MYWGYFSLCILTGFLIVAAGARWRPESAGTAAQRKAREIRYPGHQFHCFHEQVLHRESPCFTFPFAPASNLQVATHLDGRAGNYDSQGSAQRESVTSTEKVRREMAYGH